MLPHIILNNFTFPQTCNWLRIFSIWILNGYQRCNFCHSINIYIKNILKNTYLTFLNIARGNLNVNTMVIWSYHHPLSVISLVCFCSVTSLLCSYNPPEYFLLCLCCQGKGFPQSQYFSNLFFKFIFFWIINTLHKPHTASLQVFTYILSNSGDNYERAFILCHIYYLLTT